MSDLSSPSRTGFFFDEVSRRLRPPQVRRQKAAPVDPFAGLPRIRSSGNPDTARIVVVGEMPGDVEVEQGEAFVGKSGQLLRQILREEAGLHDRDVYYGNVIPYRLETLMTDAQKIQAGKTCGHYFLEELQALSGKPLILAGGIALQALTGEKGITGERGIMRRLSDGRLAFPVCHPAHILRADAAARRGLEQTLREDLRKFGVWFRQPKSPPVGHMVTTERELQQVERYLLSRPMIFFDFETHSLSAWGEELGKGRLLAVGFSTKPGEAIGISLDHEGNPLDPARAKTVIGRMLAGPAEKGGLHLQHDLHWAGQAGIEVENVRWDDMLLATLLAYKPYTEIRSNLLRLAADWLGEIEYPWLDVDKGRMAEYPVETVVGVAMTDAEWELRLHLAMMAELDQRARVA